ncbi:hypothetical protein BIY37_13080 [Candidatus Brocadia sapporoensis]|uniref:Uncharacterized protein n=1 Tax=Candidatus Brocadia sapporoensis TaxID=392547 RepID=A0A1V6LWX4_9BACT|nr:hypothetical protein BIY37_13080 [Candidatus Brocadia sapporoensis]TVL96622.1 MAG: hypothetical protein CV082_06265 [Candidatus Brocadia sp. BL1]
MWYEVLLFAEIIISYCILYYVQALVCRTRNKFTSPSCVISLLLVFVQALFTAFAGEIFFLNCNAMS